MRIYPDYEREQDDEEDVETKKGGEIIPRKDKERLEMEYSEKRKERIKMDMG